MDTGSKIRILLIIFLILLNIYVINDVTDYPVSIALKNKQELFPYKYKEMLIKPFKISWCDVLDMSPEYKMVSNLFSFSIFSNEKVLNLLGEIKPKENDIVNERAIVEWYDRYGLKQLYQFKSIFNNKSWSEFGIIHFISKECWFMPLIYFDSTIKKHRYSSKTLGEEFLSLNREFGNKYKQYMYTCPNFQLKHNTNYWDHSKKMVVKESITTPYFGTVVRFLPLIIPNVNIVLFRDAHFTIPNPHNTYDAEWRDTWLTTDKKFWVYNSPWYNPPHANGEHILLASTWGVRNMHKEMSNTIFTEKEWNSSFGSISKINNTWYETDTYGIDERLMYKMIKYYINEFNNNDFVKDSYIIGITWLQYLFVNKIDSKDLYRFKNSNNEFILNESDFQNSLPRLITDSTNKSFWALPATHFLVAHTYYSELKCVAINLIKQIAKDKKISPLNVTIKEFFDKVQELQSNINDSNLMNKKLIAMLPTKYHIIEYLFDSGAESHGFSDNTTIIKYAEYWSKIFEKLTRNKDDTEWDLLNSCDMVTRSFIGNQFLLNDYYYKKNNQYNTLPDIIPLPKKHPLYSADKSELFQYIL